MIIVKLIGGLGNQLFQYALGRRIAHIHNVPLKLDITEFGRYKLHKYNLKNFNIIEDIASADDIALFRKKSRLRRWASGVIEKFKPYYTRSIVKEQSFPYDPNILKVPENVYLDGYWQSEKYFKEIEDIIRSEFRVKHKPDAMNGLMAQNIKNVCAVSLHIRRGDYVSDPTTNNVHGTCSLEYYHQAVMMVAGKVENPHFFLFSDDSEWAKENLKMDYPITFVTHNGADKNYEDLRLMSLCRHNIIANSTFSWWGAWLNANPDKIVVAPAMWYKTKNRDAKDIIPEKWYRI